MAIRQNTRVALGDRLEALRLTTPPVEGGRPDIAAPASLFASPLVDNNTNVAMAQSLESRIPSPDELIIRQRGRRRILTDWTPEKAAALNKSNACVPFQRTPTKMPLNINMILRSSPRKRLTMGSALYDSNMNCTSNSNSPTKHNAKQQLWPETHVAKRARYCDDVKPIAQQNEGISLGTILQGLSQKQLIELIVDKLVSGNANLEAELRAQLPLPDIETMEQELLHAKRMIFKSLPTSRLCRKTDGTAYKRASLHLNEFKSSLVQHTKQLNDSGHWDALLDYVILAWPYVKSTPIWDNNSHNAVRRQCFKLLVCTCVAAVKSGGNRLGTSRLQVLEHSLQDWSHDYEGVSSCINALNKVLSN